MGSTNAIYEELLSKNDISPYESDFGKSKLTFGKPKKLNPELQGKRLQLRHVQAHEIVLKTLIVQQDRSIGLSKV
jgi:hypothetical protein